MKKIDEIKSKSFKDFLKRLSTHKLGECMDIVTMNTDYNNIKVPKQK